MKNNPYISLWISTYMLVVVLITGGTIALCAQNGTVPFSAGEKLVYNIYASGLNVGSQTIEFFSEGMVNGEAVYVLKGRSRTSPFVGIFYRLDDNWTIFIEKETLLPLRVEKDMIEGKRRAHYIYEIDQNKRKVVIHETRSGRKREVSFSHNLYDLFSLIYFYRGNPNLFNQKFTFDFLEERSVRTVHFRGDTHESVRIPAISRRTTIPSIILKQVGGIGIVIMVSNDALLLPLSMEVPSKLSKHKKITISFMLKKYTPGKKHQNVPRIYKRITR